VHGFVNIETVARRKLEMLAAARELRDLRSPPVNGWNPSKATGPVGTAFINDQWRICFRWRGGGAENVEIVDYH
jgi:toxin HigB-1